MLRSASIATLVFTAACSGQRREPAPVGPAPAVAGFDKTEAGPTVGEGVAKLRAGDPAAAAAIFSAITEREPDNGEVWILRGIAERFAGDTAAAEKSLRRAAALESSAPRAYYQLAVLAAATKDKDAAFAWLEKAVATGKADITGIAIEAGGALDGDPRLAALMPDAAALADPFVEKDAAVIREWRGEAAGDQFGWIARNIGDVDGDQIADVTTSAPTAKDRAGVVYAFSSRTGKRLWAVTGEPRSRLGLGVEAAGDVDGDGIGDVIAGAPDAGKAVVLGGRDGKVLLELIAEDKKDFFGRKVSDAGDVDGDGHADVLVGAPRNRDGRGAVYLYSGRDGSTLLTLRGERPGDRFGAAMGAAMAGGQLMLAVGAPDAGERRAGAVYVYRGLGSKPRFSFAASETGDELGGMFVSICGDVDGDNTPDVFATDWSDAARGPTTGRAFVHSGADGRRIHTFTGEAAGDGFGIGVADAGDVTGDGHADLVIGAWRHGSAAPGGGKVYLYSGRDGSLIRAWTGKVMGETLGFDTTGLGDVDGDGGIDLLVTSGWSPVSGARTGRVFILRGPRPKR